MLIIVLSVNIGYLALIGLSYDRNNEFFRWVFENVASVNMQLKAINRLDRSIEPHEIMWYLSMDKIDLALYEYVKSSDLADLEYIYGMFINESFEGHHKTPLALLEKMKSADVKMKCYAIYSFFSTDLPAVTEALIEESKSEHVVVRMTVANILFRKVDIEKDPVINALIYDQDWRVSATILSGMMGWVGEREDINNFFAKRNNLVELPSQELLKDIKFPLGPEVDDSMLFFDSYMEAWKDWPETK